MAKINIKFNNKTYSINPASLADATATLEAHLMGMMEERLEGDGAEYYTLAPTALSFRSTAPLSELQEIQINGVTVDPVNYILEEGSTIVTFPIEYLKTLNVGSYEVNVVSDSKAVKGGFNVKAPELNEHGFYYNQPYSGYIAAFDATLCFFMREDGTADGIDVGAGVVAEISLYSVSGNTITVNTSGMGDLTASISVDGNSIYCNELATTFELGDESIAADDDYIYIYKEGLSGYEVQCIDKTKTEYGAIKTGINGFDTVKLADEMCRNNTNLMVLPQIPDDVQYISDMAFSGCTGLTSIIIPDSVTSIGRYAFSGCTSLTSIEIPSGVTYFNDSAFSGCTSLASVEIPDIVTYIGYDAFNSCTSLTSINFDGTMKQWNAITKNTGWNLNVPATHVHCTDGDVAL